MRRRVILGAKPLIEKSGAFERPLRGVFTVLHEFELFLMEQTVDDLLR